MGTQHSEEGKRRWQVEVIAEQFSAVGVEVRREALGVEGGAGARAGITVVKGNSNLPPRPGRYPQSSMALLSQSVPIGENLLSGNTVFLER